MTFRFAGVIFLFTSLYFALGLKAYEIQIRQGRSFLAKAQLQWGASAPTRGAILFAAEDGRDVPVAITKKTKIVYAAPKEISDPEEYAATVSRVIGIPYERLLDIFRKSNDPYELLLDTPTKDQIGALANINLKGIYVGERPERFYPLGMLGAHVIGFTGETVDSPALTGRYGTEAQFDRVLAGSEFGNGADVRLTIDHRIQAEGERILTNLIARVRARGGVFIVQEPATGKILAMGGAPSFDPNTYGSFPLERFVNRSVQALYEPGSIYKVVTMAAGIDSGAITPATTYVDTGSVTFNGRTIRNWDRKAYGKTTMTGVIEHSLNVGAVFAQRKTGRDAFLSYLTAFGFGERTGIDLPGEIAGSLRTLTTNVEDINYATASFGQGVSVTPIQLINAVSAIANGGTLMRPFVNADSAPQTIRTVITRETAKSVTDMMISAVDTATVAALPGYAIAGKTGTAQVPDFTHGGYTSDVINTYVGFGPAAKPRFTILVRIDEPEGAPLAGTTVVPAFRQYAQFIVNYLNIPPDRLPAQ
ncbi:MAG: penicillin-binding protein 2 [Candidatus Liptonbacteria bacterium]|nr:penicillin-binding protein 2 [Candidatus Liptonbacteria bacterium]